MAHLQCQNQEICKLKETIVENTAKDECKMSARICNKPMSPDTEISSRQSANELQIWKEKDKEEKKSRIRAETQLEEIKSSEKKRKQLTTQQHKKTATVQIFRHSKFKEYAVEGHLMSRLKKNISSHNITLEHYACTPSASVMEDLVVLGFVSHEKRSKKNKTIENFLTEFSGPLTKLAVVVFHHKNEFETQKEADEYEKVHDSVRLVVHVGHFSQGLSQSTLNSKAVESLEKFIQKHSALESSF